MKEEERGLQTEMQRWGLVYLFAQHKFMVWMVPDCFLPHVFPTYGAL
jgi:hypothetical protein